ncbi:hypothetical protein ACIGZJ_34535 [Kitasatospora sp. NPDC052868]|uniref:hypothetical protein n=1 Tax=Kitasatospora sp. NPDC052868 TaxID=3364060 RepID=UPI0037C6E3A9
MTSIAHQNPIGSTGATLTLHPQALSVQSMVDALTAHRSAPLQVQYEDQVIALVIRDLTSADPAASVGAVNAVVAEVWKQAAEHVEKAATTWTHISWFVQNAVTEFIEGLRPQMAGC